MSKVKNIPDKLCTPKLKEKYRSGLRRIESEKIKKRRMENAKKFRYGYRYYLKDSLTIHERVEINVPERTRAKYHWEMERKQFEASHGQVYTKCFYEKVFNGYEIVPAHIETHSMVIKEIPRKPYLKMINEPKKWLKRQAARKVRKAPQDDLLNHNDYKRLFDLWWALW